MKKERKTDYFKKTKKRMKKLEERIENSEKMANNEEIKN